MYYYVPLKLPLNLILTNVKEVCRQLKKINKSNNTPNTPIG